MNASKSASPFSTRISLHLILWLGFALRVWRLGAQSYWWDELSTVARTAVSLPALFQNLFTVRNHMPLYFIIMRAWATIGQDAFVMRFFSVVCGVIMIPLIYLVGKRIVSREVGLVAAFLLAINPFHIWYSQETRMYTLVSLALLLTHYFLFKLLDRSNRRDWIGYTVSFTVAIYTHFLALFLLMAHYVFFSLSYRRIQSLFLQWLFYGGIVGVLFAFWGGFIMLTGGFGSAPIGWIAPAGITEPFWSLVNFASGPASLNVPIVGIVMLLFFLGLIVFVWRIYGRLPETSLIVRLLLLWAFVPLLLQFLISLDLPIPNKRSIYVDRYLINSLPAFLLLVSWGIVELGKRLSNQTTLYVALGLVTVGTAVSLAPIYNNPAFAREDWNNAFAQLSSQRTEDEVLFLNGSQTLPLDYYGNSQWPIEILPFEFELEEKVDYFDETLPEQLAPIVAEGGAVWVLTAVENTNPHGFPQERNQAVAQIETHDPFLNWFVDHYPIQQTIQTTGVQITQFDLSQ